MKETAYLFLAMAVILSLAGASILAKDKTVEMEYDKLTAKEKSVIVDKGTEAPFSGKYVHYKGHGVYTCKLCGAPLFESDTKFDSGSGWPSFDDAIEGAVREVPDEDGMRVEIVCAKCGAHLGHVFRGEGFTKKNTRHCVNSVSLDFVSGDQATTESGDVEVAYFAGGCFWGVEYLLEKEEGVLEATSGYMGGHVDNPTYEQVSYFGTGHAETVEVKFNPKEVSYETLARLFFEIHDPTQRNRQGPDVGTQYRSAVFYTSMAQKNIAKKLVKELERKGFDVVTQVVPATAFWPAEDYHQDYYDKSGKEPYCHSRVERF